MEKYFLYTVIWTPHGGPSAPRYRTYAAKLPPVKILSELESNPLVNDFAAHILFSAEITEAEYLLMPFNHDLTD